MTCDWCDGRTWLLDEYEPGVGFTYKPCPKCSWPHRVLSPIPAPVDGLEFGVSDTARIRLGEEHEWAQHGPAW